MVVIADGPIQFSSNRLLTFMKLLDSGSEIIFKFMYRYPEDTKRSSYHSVYLFWLYHNKNSNFTKKILY